MTFRQTKQLLLSGDVETNPGPTGRRSVAQGPSLDEQVYSLNSQVRAPSHMLVEVEQSDSNTST